MHCRQLIDYIGKTVYVEMKDGSHIDGELSFFHLDKQIIHLSNYSTTFSNDSVLTHDKGVMKIINFDEWATITIK